MGGTIGGGLYIDVIVNGGLFEIGLFVVFVVDGSESDKEFNESNVDELVVFDDEEVVAVVVDGFEVEVKLEFKLGNTNDGLGGILE